ncbi:MAG: hypothetical protein K5769_00435 [Pseudobutyrivibrio sp.]|nr:hypothetical protein [Pseudobutyrivibrio sp.]
MARVYRHRHGSSGGRSKALPIEAMYAAGVSLVSLIVYGAIIGGSVYLAGETPKWLGGLGTLGYIVAICAFVYNIRQMKKQTEIKYRIICMGISSVSMIVWTVTIIIGMIK